jgi:hypothetical protein
VKSAIDAVYKATAPAYLMILGSVDVVPHQALTNPVSDPNDGDPDETVPSDLPYACDAAYSQDPARFIGPTRVVGRLPDMVGATRPDYLIRVIGTAAKRQTRTAADYSAHFGITAWEWQQSTNLSLQKLFGSGAKLKTSPQLGPDWEDAHLASRSHFINCHGALATPKFFGQKGQSYPVAHESRSLTGRVTDGTVAAVECCYGAELYNPSNSGNVMGIGYGYLGNGAYGYCGSTTVAYGPAEGNAQADLLCRYFLQRVMAGSSLGRAMLEARQQFAQGAAQLDPYDMKTLAQFYLLGDPSIHPVEKSGTTTPVGKGFAAAAGETLASRAVNRADRRRLLIRIGQQIQETQLVPERILESAPATALRRALRKIAAEAGLDGDGSPMTFTIGKADGKTSRATPKGAFAKLAPPEVFHVIAERFPGAVENDFCVKGVVAREKDGQIIAYRKVMSR